jgi:Protein of unknown function (DUF3592)
MFPPLQLLIPGVVALLLVLIIVFFMFRSFFAAFDVRRRGTNVSATVTRIDAELLPSTRNSQTPSYFLHAEWEDPRTHKLYHFKSPAGGVRLPLDHPPGSKIDVRINPRNPRHYEVMLGIDERSYV